MKSFKAFKVKVIGNKTHEICFQKKSAAEMCYIKTQQYIANTFMDAPFETTTGVVQANEKPLKFCTFRGASDCAEISIACSLNEELIDCPDSFYEEEFGANTDFFDYCQDFWGKVVASTFLGYDEEYYGKVESQEAFFAGYRVDEDCVTYERAYINSDDVLTACKKIGVKIEDIQSGNLDYGELYGDFFSALSEVLYYYYSSTDTDIEDFFNTQEEFVSVRKNGKEWCDEDLMRDMVQMCRR